MPFPSVRSYLAFVVWFSLTIGNWSVKALFIVMIDPLYDYYTTCSMMSCHFPSIKYIKSKSEDGDNRDGTFDQVRI